MPPIAQPSVDNDTSVENKPPIHALDQPSANLVELTVATSILHVKTIHQDRFHLLANWVIFLSLFICLCSYVAHINISHTFVPKTTNDHHYLKNATTGKNSTGIHFAGGRLVPREKRETTDPRCFTDFTKGAVQDFVDSQEDARMWLANCANVPVESNGPSSGDYEFWLSS